MQTQKISLWVRLLIIVAVSVPAAFALLFFVQGDNKAAAGGFFIAALISPLLPEVLWPGKYMLRKPDGERPDNLINRLKQFRIDHPGLDGTFFLLIFALIGAGLLAGAFVQITASFGIRMR